jgi:RNA polymerase sigma-70 factor (sigma-E family)
MLGDWLTGRTVQRDFDEFVNGATDDLVRTAYLLTWDEGETEDLVQETLLLLARRWTRVGTMEYPSAYARRVMTNLAIDGRVRRRRRRDELRAGGQAVESRPDGAALRALGVVEDDALFHRALDDLPDRQRTVIVLRYWADLKEVDIAERLGCSVGTVKSTLSRGLARLRQSMTDSGALELQEGHEAL